MSRTNFRPPPLLKALIGQAVSEMFEHSGRRMTYDGRTPEHGYTIKLTNEPLAKGELKSMYKDLCVAW